MYWEIIKPEVRSTGVGQASGAADGGSPANCGSRPSSHSQTWHHLVSGLTVTFSTIRRVRTLVNRTVDLKTKPLTGPYVRIQ